MDERKRSQQTATDAPEFIRAVERLGLISFKNKKKLYLEQSSSLLRRMPRNFIHSERWLWLCRTQRYLSRQNIS